jgi:hypothetical protein
MVSNQVRRPSTRKCSSSSVRCSRSTLEGQQAFEPNPAGTEARRPRRAVGLRPLDPGGAVLDGLELEEELIRMLVGAAAELAAVVGEHDVDLGVCGLESRQHVAIHQMHRRHRQLARVELAQAYRE